MNPRRIELVGGPFDGEHHVMAIPSPEWHVPAPERVRFVSRSAESVEPTPRVAVYRFSKATDLLAFYEFAGYR